MTDGADKTQAAKGHLQSGDPAGYIELWQIKPLIDSSAQSGVDVDGLFRDLGFTESIERLADNTPLRLSDYFRLQRFVAQSLDDLTVKLSSRKLTYRTGQFVLSQMSQSRTLKDVLESLCEHFNMMHGGAYNSVRQRGDMFVLTVDDSTFPYTFREDRRLTKFVGDTLLIKVHCLLDSLSGGLAERALRRISLRRSRDEPGGFQNGFWSVPIQYASNVYELVYDFEDVCRPIPDLTRVELSTLGVFAHVLDWLDAHEANTNHMSMTARVRAVIADGVEDQPRVARDLGISVATLRRRLAEEGTRFRDLVQERRLSTAHKLLEAGISAPDVAERLGYSDVRAFYRAFKKARGVTPTQYCRKHLPGSDETHA